MSNVILVNIDVWGCVGCGGRTGIVPHREALHRAIAQTILLTPGQLGVEQLIFLRKALKWSRQAFATALAVTPETVIQWEGGRQALSPVTDRLLRLVVLPQVQPEAPRRWMSQAWDSEYYFLLYVPLGPRPGAGGRAGSSRPQANRGPG